MVIMGIMMVMMDHGGDDDHDGDYGDHGGDDGS